MKTIKHSFLAMVKHFQWAWYIGYSIWKWRAFESDNAVLDFIVRVYKVKRNCPLAHELAFYLELLQNQTYSQKTTINKSGNIVIEFIPIKE